MSVSRFKNFVFFLWLFYQYQDIFIFFKTNQMQNIITDVEKTEIIYRKQDFPIIKTVKLIRFLVIIFQFSKNCFLRTYVAFKVLSYLGIDSNFKIGINADDKFKSHSWLEIGGKLLEEEVTKIQMMSIIYSLKK